MLNISKNGRKSGIWHSQLQFFSGGGMPPDLPSILGCFATSGKALCVLHIFLPLLTYCRREISRITLNSTWQLCSCFFYYFKYCGISMGSATWELSSFSEPGRVFSTYFNKLFIADLPHDTDYPYLKRILADF